MFTVNGYMDGYWFGYMDSVRLWHMDGHYNGIIKHTAW